MKGVSGTEETLSQNLSVAMTEGDLSEDYDEEAPLPEEVEEEIISEEEEKALHEHIKLEKTILFIGLLGTLFLALVSSVMTSTAIVYTMLGFLPTIIVLIICIFLVEENFKDGVLWFTAIIIPIIFFLLGDYINVIANNQLDILSLTGINLLVSITILVVAFILTHTFNSSKVKDEEHVLVEEFTPENMDKYIHTIEDKCKALNFVIGRVYRASNGGSKTLREKIRVPSELYNEFNAIKPEELEEKKQDAVSILIRIEDRLNTLLKPESNVFSNSEVKALKRLARDSTGKDRIIDVLSVNDEDPVQDYYLGAVDFCQVIIKHLKEMK